MNHLLEIYCELYRRKEYSQIPIGKGKEGNYYLSKKQLLALQYFDDPLVKSIGYGGSARSGKTLLECFVALFDCLSYPGVAWAIGRKELVRIRKTVMVTMWELCGFYGLKPNVDFKYDAQENKIKFENGSVIFFIDMKLVPSDPLFTRFGGLELTRAAVDESNESNYQGIITLMSRTNWKKNDVYGISATMLETFNPDKGHVYLRFYKPYRDKIEAENRKFIPALPSDNPHPSIEGWIKSIIEEGDKVMIERLVRGNFDYDDDPAKLLEYDEILNMFTNSFVRPGKDRYISTDIALHGSDLFTIFVWFGWRLKRVYSIQKCDADEVERLLKSVAERWKVPRSNIIYDADGLGTFLRGYLKGAKPFVNGSTPLEMKKGEKENYVNLKTQCIYEICKVIKNNEIYIEPDAFKDEKQKDEFIEELQQFKRDKVDEEGKKYVIPKKIIKENIGRSSDHSDGFMQRMWFELKNKKKKLGSVTEAYKNGGGLFS